MLTHSQADKVDTPPASRAKKRQDNPPPRGRMIRLDRHIRQAEFADLLRGRV